MLGEAPLYMCAHARADLYRAECVNSADEDENTGEQLERNEGCNGDNEKSSIRRQAAASDIRHSEQIKQHEENARLMNRAHPEANFVVAVSVQPTQREQI